MQKCAHLISDLLGDCRGHIDIDKFYANCLSDMCKDESGDNRPMCHITKQVDFLCSRKGFPFYWYLDETLSTLCGKLLPIYVHHSAYKYTTLRYQTSNHAMLRRHHSNVDVMS